MDKPDNKVPPEFSYDIDSMEAIRKAQKADAFQNFTEKCARNFNYNPETDQIDLKKIFDYYVWR